MTDIDLTALESQFRGRKYAELVIQHINNPVDPIQASNGIAAEMPQQVRELSFEWLEIARGHLKEPGFFARDCGDVLSLISSEASPLLRRVGIKSSDENRFNMFLLATLLYAHYGKTSPTIRDVIRGEARGTAAKRAGCAVVFALFTAGALAFSVLAS